MTGSAAARAGALPVRFDDQVWAVGADDGSLGFDHSGPGPFILAVADAVGLYLQVFNRHRILAGTAADNVSSRRSKIRTNRWRHCISLKYIENARGALVGFATSGAFCAGR
jgi:hypothetical protein